MLIFRALSMLLAAVAVTATSGAASALDIRPDEAAATCGAHVPQVQVTVGGVTPQGILTVELYLPSDRDFLRKASRLHRIRVPAEQGPQTVCFDIPQAGVYAIAAYHDLDGDRKLARKWNQLPDEPFALSNNRPLRLAMPDFNDAAFEVGEQGGAIQIELRR